eukprot:403376869
MKNQLSKAREFQNKSMIISSRDNFRPKSLHKNVMSPKNHHSQEDLIKVIKEEDYEESINNGQLQQFSLKNTQSSQVMNQHQYSKNQLGSVTKSQESIYQTKSKLQSKLSQYQSQQDQYEEDFEQQEEQRRDNTPLQPTRESKLSQKLKMREQSDKNNLTLHQQQEQENKDQYLLQNQQSKSFSLPDVTADDSASQIFNNMQNNLQNQSQINSHFKNQSFASNLEQAKILVQITRERVQAIHLGSNERNNSQQLNEEVANIVDDDPNEHERQKKINKYLSQTIKLLNANIDVLLDQYNPVKLKGVQNLPQNQRQKNTQQNLQISQEQQDSLEIQKKIEEIKNAQKSLKIQEKELNYLQKRENRLRDEQYIMQLFTRVDENQGLIDSIQKENLVLQQVQKQTERKIERKQIRQQNWTYKSGGNNQISNHNVSKILGSDNNANDQNNLLINEEMQQLENELQSLNQKYTQLQYKEQTLMEKEAILKEKLQSMQTQEKLMEAKEQRMIDKAQNQYGINFQDKDRLIQDELNENRLAEKDAYLKKIAILKQSLESNKKNYQVQTKTHIKSMKQFEEQNHQLQRHLDMLNSQITEDQEDLKTKIAQEEIKIKQRQEFLQIEQLRRQQARSTDYTQLKSKNSIQSVLENQGEIINQIKENRQKLSQKSILERLEEQQISLQNKNDDIQEKQYSNDFEQDDDIVSVIDKNIDSQLINDKNIEQNMSPMSNKHSQQDDGLDIIHNTQSTIHQIETAINQEKYFKINRQNQQKPNALQAGDLDNVLRKTSDIQIKPFKVSKNIRDNSFDEPQINIKNGFVQKRESTSTVRYQSNPRSQYDQGIKLSQYNQIEQTQSDQVIKQADEALRQSQPLLRRQNVKINIESKKSLLIDGSQNNDDFSDYRTAINKQD